jgi:hypothetical protein
MRSSLYYSLYTTLSITASALMLLRISGEVDHADVVVVDVVVTLEGAVELVKKLAQPRGLCHTVGHSVVLGLCAGVGDDGLPLDGLGDEVGAQEHRITGSGLVRVGTASPVSVGVDHELRRWGGSEYKVVIERAT